MENDPIQITIGASIDADGPMTFWLEDEGCKMGADLTPADLLLAVASLMDLADAIKAHVNRMALQ